ncbi:MAG TPA: chemotaxis protein CheW [Terriglobales bacterium]|nr:chemotaxis protein CheW [Terriglobales bacterium]
MSASLSQNGAAQAFVLFPLGDKRFALPATTVRELAKQDELQTFPHTTPLLTGVVLRREQVVPVCDLAPVLVGAETPERKFFLIVSSEESNSAMAIPVTGECELTEAEQLPITGTLPPYVCGLLSLKDEIVEVLDLPSAIVSEVRA